MPTNILVEKDGTVAWIHYGYIPGDEVNRKKIVEVLINESARFYCHSIIFINF